MTRKAQIVILIAGTLVAIGMVTSFYGARLITQDIPPMEGILNGTTPIQITKELDPTKTKTAVFVVQTEKLDDAIIAANVYDPNNKSIVSKTIDQNNVEGQFDISIKGSYKLELSNSKQTEVPVRIVLGYMPDKILIALNYLGQMFILSGFVGVVIAGLYALKDRRKTQLR